MSGRGGHNRRFLRAEDGSLTIEFVVMMPVLLAGLAFAFEFGRLMIAHHTTVNNVRSATRYLSRADLALVENTGSTVRTQVDNIIRTGVPTGGELPAWVNDADDITIVVTPAQATFSDADFRDNGQVLRVQTTVNFRFLIFQFINIFNDPTPQGGFIPIVIVEDMRHVGD